uniref:dTDP-4-dehydrorhamnose reductase n=1 Tax=Candidatus Fimivicinus sp. TaxID=3056640 RepID=UPI003FEE31D9
MKILVTGANGQLGYDVLKELHRRKIPCRGIDREECDITNMPQVMHWMETYLPDAVIHCAAYTDVNRAQTEQALCMDINYRGSANIAAAANKTGAKLVYISTDYVFGASNDRPLHIYDDKKPLNVYGETKLSGENSTRILCPRSFIVRISWVFGINGSNFVKTMLRLGREKEEICVVNDQIGSPTYTADLAPLLCDMALTERFGTYHATNEGYCSWYEFASEIMRITRLPAKVIPVSTAEYSSAAARPLNSRLSKESLDEAGFARLPHWRDALQRYLSELAIAEEEGIIKAF